MPAELRSEILLPARSPARRVVGVAVGCSVLGASFALLAMPLPTETVTVVTLPAEPPAAAPIARSSELSLVISAGGASYVKLADLADEAEVMPKHGTPTLHSNDDGEAAVAHVETADVPQAYRGWLGRRVVVDSTCTTQVTGFAVVARLTGDTGYASIDAEAWTGATVLEHGGVVLAAKLAGCTGSYARAAELAPVIALQEIEDATLAAAARTALLASRPARDAQLEWQELDQDVSWWESKFAQLSMRVVRHPTTGATFVSAHGSIEPGCGEPEINIWGLYRVERDGSLAAVQLRKLGDLWSIDKLIDIEGDGELELIGKPWLGLDTIVTRSDGEELERVSVPFFGCSC